MELRRLQRLQAVDRLGNDLDAGVTQRADDDAAGECVVIGDDDARWWVRVADTKKKANDRPRDTSLSAP